MTHFSLILLRWTASDNRALILIKVGADWLNLIFFSYIKLCWLKPCRNSEKYSDINFKGREINVIVLPPRKWSILHPKLYTEYKYLTHIHKIFISFEHIVSSDRSWFTLLNYLRLDTWNNLFIKTLVLYG